MKMPSLLESGMNFLSKAFQVSLIFSFLAVIIAYPLSDIFGKPLYCTVTDWHENCAGVPLLDWNTGSLENAIEKLQSGIAVNVITAIPQLIVAAATLLVKTVINALILVNAAIQFIIKVIFMLVELPAETASILANILAWTLEAPLILGIMAELGRIISLFLPFGSQAGG